jgi:hypothetical protein
MLGPDGEWECIGTAETRGFDKVESTKSLLLREIDKLYSDCTISVQDTSNHYGPSS